MKQTNKQTAEKILKRPVWIVSLALEKYTKYIKIN
jgi:hypothetical protein